MLIKQSVSPLQARRQCGSPIHLTDNQQIRINPIVSSFIIDQSYQINQRPFNFEQSKNGDLTDFQSANIYMLFLINLPIIFCKPFNGRVFAEKREQFRVKLYILNTA